MAGRLETCAYAGTGNVLKVQRLLGLAGEHNNKEEEEEEEPLLLGALKPCSELLALPRCRN